MSIRRSPLILLALVTVLVLIVALAIAILALRDDDDTPSEDLTPVTLFMSYVPSVQFAHVYVAAERGYFADEGIDIRFENGFNEADGVERLASDDLQFGLISGEQVILARAQDRPVVYVYEWYEHYPVGIVVPQGSAPPNLTGGRDALFPCFDGHVPARDFENFAVLQEPLAAGAIGRSAAGPRRSRGPRPRSSVRGWHPQRRPPRRPPPRFPAPEPPEGDNLRVSFPTIVSVTASGDDLQRAQEALERHSARSVAVWRADNGDWTPVAAS